VIISYDKPDEILQREANNRQSANTYGQQEQPNSYGGGAKSLSSSGGIYTSAQ